MLNNFKKSLDFLSVDTSNMNHVAHDKNVYKFADENVNKHWLCFYAFYKSGNNDAVNNMNADLVKHIKV